MPTKLRSASADEVADEWPRRSRERREDAKALVDPWQPYCLITLTAHEAGEVLYRCGDVHFPVRCAANLCPDSLRHQARHLRAHGCLLKRPIIYKRGDGQFVSVDGAHRLRAAFDSGTGLHEAFCGEEPDT